MVAPYSPDLNPAEYAINYLKQAASSTMFKLKPEERTCEKVAEVLEDEWKKMPIKKLQNVIDGIPRKIKESYRLYGLRPGEKYTEPNWNDPQWVSLNVSRHPIIPNFLIN